MRTNDELRVAADRLQTTSERIVEDLDLVARASSQGDVLRIGSASFGMMALPDIDLGVLCPVLDTAGIFQVAHALFAHPRVKRVSITDERGPFQSMPGPEDEGIYCGIRYLDGDVEWKIDLWFFPAAAPRPEIDIRERLRAASDAERIAILRIKHELITSGHYGRNTHGIDIYRAVLNRGERSLESVIDDMVQGSQNAD